MNIPQTEKKRIVIIGGGFAGISLAKNLRGLDLQIVMIDKRNYHTFQPLLYQVSTSGLEPDSIAYPLRKVLKRLNDFYFRMAEVERIDPEAHIVYTPIGTLTFDYLVLATGTRTNFFGNAGIQAHAMPMKTVPQALNIRSLLLQNFEKADRITDTKERKAYMNFCIVGAGPTGVELAGALAELKRHVFPKDYKHLDVNEMNIHLFEGADRVLSPMSEHASKKASDFLKNLGVHIHTNTLASDYDGKVLSLANGDALNTKNVIWAAGVTGASIPGFGPESLAGRSNRYKVNAFNQVEDYPHIFALGDIAYMETDAFPKGHPQVAQPAIQQGKHLAKNLKRWLAGEPMQPFTYFDKGTMATVGRNKAVVDVHRFKFAGFFAWYVWMFIHLWYLVGFRNRVVVFFNWAYNYINFDKAARLIIRPYRPKK